MYTRIRARHDTTHQGGEGTKLLKDFFPRPADRGEERAGWREESRSRVDSLPFSTCRPPPRGIGIDPLFGPRICCQRVAVVPPRILILARGARQACRGKSPRSRGVNWTGTRDRSLHGTRATRKRSRNMVSDRQQNHTSSVRERAPRDAGPETSPQSISRSAIERDETSRESRVSGNGAPSGFYLTDTRRDTCRPEVRPRTVRDSRRASGRKSHAFLSGSRRRERERDFIDKCARLAYRFTLLIP